MPTMRSQLDCRDGVNHTTHEERVMEIIEHDGNTEWSDCFSCGAHVTDGSEKCPKCGGRLGLAATAAVFLALPKTTLPNAQFIGEEDSWAQDPWEVLRESARSGQSCESICGSKIRAQADRNEWIGGIIID